MSGLSGSNDSEKLADLSTKNYKAQAIWFLNAFWPQFGGEAEKIWNFKHTFDELDHDRKGDGCALDELQAHRFLEKFHETMTVQAMREKLRSTGAVANSFKLIPLAHILIFKYNADWHHLVNAPQGNKEEVAKAQALLDEVQNAFMESEQKDAEAAAALRESQARESEAKRDEAAAKRDEAEAVAREDEARRQEAPFKAAQEEVDSALAEVKAQEDYRNNRTEELKRKSTEGGVVQQNKAKNELAQHLAEDPLPLRKAKITLEAALKKAEKARAPFEAATKEAEAARAAAEKSARQAEEARRRAEAATRKSEQAKAAAEEALEEARRRLEEAEAYLEEAKKRLPEGQIWWLDRELQERRKYLPKAKGGVDK